MIRTCPGCKMRRLSGNKVVFYMRQHKQWLMTSDRKGDDGESHMERHGDYMVHCLFRVNIYQTHLPVHFTRNTYIPAHSCNYPSSQSHGNSTTPQKPPKDHVETGQQFQCKTMKVLLLKITGFLIFPQHSQFYIQWMFLIRLQKHLRRYNVASANFMLSQQPGDRLPPPMTVLSSSCFSGFSYASVCAQHSTVIINTITECGQGLLFGWSRSLV